MLTISAVIEIYTKSILQPGSGLVPAAEVAEAVHAHSEGHVRPEGVRPEAAVDVHPAAVASGRVVAGGIGEAAVLGARDIVCRRGVCRRVHLAVAFSENPSAFAGFALSRFAVGYCRRWPLVRHSSVPVPDGFLGGLPDDIDPLPSCVFR